MSKRILVLGQFSPYPTDKGFFRAPLIADTLDRLIASGAECMVGAPAWVGQQDQVAHVALPADITAPPYTARFALRGTRYLLRLAAGACNDPWWNSVRSFAPDMVLALNPNSLAFAKPIASILRARLVLYELGGISLGSVFHSKGAFRPVLAEFYAPLFAGVDALISVEDSTALHATTPVARLPPSMQLHVPVPHRTWTHRTRTEIDALAGLPPLQQGQRRVAWAGRFEKVKRPTLFLRIARHLLEAEGQSVQVVMVGATKEAARFDPELTRDIVFPGMVSNARLEAILQSSDLATFTALLSVAGTIFRETVAAGVPVAATIEPKDLLLFTLLDVERDVVQLDARDPEGAAEAIRGALNNPAALRQQADAARMHLEARGEPMDGYIRRVTSFLSSLLYHR
ncbi:MAG TPA: glycosyltransferase family 4 protein [Polyangiaceae bacterium]|jgi:glycosyltransferase involved in cell wall biosynthesis